MATQDKGTGSSDTKQAAKSGKLDLAEKPDSNNGHGEPQAVDSKAADSKLALRGNAPDANSSIELAGVRPIGSSQLEIYATILNNRPIAASHLRVLDYSLPGRPIFESGLAIREDLTLPGGRPVMVSDPKLMEASGLPGGRPIAPNDTGDGEILMGFLD